VFSLKDQVQIEWQSELGMLISNITVSLDGKFPSDFNSHGILSDYNGQTALVKPKRRIVLDMFGV